MSNAQAIVLEYLESVWNQNDATAFEALTTPDFVYHLGGQPSKGRSEMRQFLDMVRSAFPDWRVEVIECITENNRVAVRWRGEVTHLGAFHNIPPSGKRISVSGINIYHVADGKITAEWEQMDSLGMLGQIGMPAPASP